MTLYKDDIKPKSFQLIPTLSKDNKTILLDTTVAIFYSAYQNFELVRELCPVVDRSFEGIRYLGRHIGLAEFRYCNGNGNIGVWKEYDSNGNVIKIVNHGNSDRLEELKQISYDR